MVSKGNAGAPGCRPSLSKVPRRATAGGEVRTWRKVRQQQQRQARETKRRKRNQLHFLSLFRFTILIVLNLVPGATGFWGLFGDGGTSKVLKQEQAQHAAQWSAMERADRVQAEALAHAAKAAASASAAASTAARGGAALDTLPGGGERVGLAGSKHGRELPFVHTHHLAYTIPYWWAGGKVLLEPKKSSTLLFNHVPKTGGTFVKALLAAAIPLANRAPPLYYCKEGYEPTVHFGRFNHYRKCGKATSQCKKSKTGTCRWIRHEKEAHALEDSVRAFTIAGIRNPCDYYLSLWAFGSDGEKSGFKDQNPDLLPLYGKTKPYTNPEDLELFFRWLVNPKVRGLFTERVVGSVGWQPSGTMDLNAADCWLHSDHLLPTLRGCLRQFEAGGGKVNWEEFEKVVESYDNDDNNGKTKSKSNGDTLAQGAGIAGAKSGAKEDIRNASPHGKCFEHYNATGIAAVMEADAAIFKLFPFAKCCSTIHSDLIGNKVE